MHSKRRKFERSTNVYNLPLPWRPGWRNLISGRAMGGNRFPDESYAAYVRRVLMQVPYYVPPVVIANLVRKEKHVFFVVVEFGAANSGKLQGDHGGRVPWLGSRSHPVSPPTHSCCLTQAEACY